MADELHAWAATLAPLKTVVAIKPHVSGAMDLPEKALWLVNQVASPWVKLVYDYSHYELHELDMRETMRQLVGQSVFAQIKDSEGNAARFKFLLPGDGRMDYKAYVQALTAAGYRGAVVVEVSAKFRDSQATTLSTPRSTATKKSSFGVPVNLTLYESKTISDYRRGGFSRDHSRAWRGRGAHERALDSRRRPRRRAKLLRLSRRRYPEYRPARRTRVLVSRSSTRPLRCAPPPARHSM